MATAFALKAHMGVGYTPGADVKDVSTIYIYIIKDCSRVHSRPEKRLVTVRHR